MIQAQFETPIQILRTDNTEYFNHTLEYYVQKHGIVYKSSCVYTPQQNGIVERKNRHLLEVIQALMFTTNMLKTFWRDVILTTTYLINRMSIRILFFETTL